MAGRAAQRDSVGDLLSGGGSRGAPASISSRVQAQQRKEDYAAELRAQIAAKEAAKQRERAHSLRQSAALLDLRQAAPSAVLPGGAGGAADLGAQPRWQQQHAQQQREQEWAPHEAATPAWAQQLPSHHQHPPPGWPSSGHPLHHAASGPPEPDWSVGAGWPPGPTAGPPWRQPASPQRSVHPPQGYPQPGGTYFPGDGLPGLQPPFGVDRPGAPPPALPDGWQPSAERAPFGTDLQPPQLPPIRSRSLHFSGGDGAMPAAAPWGPFGGGAGPGEGPRGMPGGASNGQMSAIGRGGATRQAVQDKQAAYKADLERQMRDKEDRRRREKEADQASAVRQAAQAEQLLRRAAAGSYGGGSGPLRDSCGRPITDLNAVRRHQAQVTHEKLEAAGAFSPDSPGSRRSIALEHGVPGGWHDGGATSVAPSPARQPSGAGWVLAEQHHQHAMPPPLMRQPSGPPDWQQQAMPPSPMRQPSGEWQHQAPGGEAHGWSDAPRPHAAARLPREQHPPGFSHQPPAEQHEQQAGSLNRTGSLKVPAVGGGTETMTVNLRSDRPYQTASEAERRQRTQAEFQAALRAQVEEKARLKAEEEHRRKAEDAAEEARLEREQDRMRQQFASDQAKQKAKQAAKEAGAAQTLEAGGVTIKFKPPPAGRQRQQGQDAGRADGRSSGAVDPDDVVPGIDIRVKGPPPARLAAPPAEHDAGPTARQQQQPPQQQQSQQQQLEQQEPPPAPHSQRQLQSQGSGAWPTAQSFEGPFPSGMQQQQGPPPGGAYPGPPSQQPWQQQGPPSQQPWQQQQQQQQQGMMVGGPPPPIPPPPHQQQSAPAGPSWQQAWGPPAPPGMYAYAGGTPPGWGMQPPPPLPPHMLHYTVPPPQWGQMQMYRSPPGAAAPPPYWAAQPDSPTVLRMSSTLPLAPPAPWGQPPPEMAAPLPPRAGGFPLYETRGVLKVHDSFTVVGATPCTTTGAHQLRLGSLPATAGRATPSQAEDSAPVRNTLSFPPQPPLVVLPPEPQPHAARQSGSAGGEAPAAGGRSRQATTQHSLAPWERLQDVQADPAGQPAAAPSHLQLPPLPRQRSQQHPPETQGSARRRSSWAGLFGGDGGAAELPSSHWPS